MADNWTREQTIVALSVYCKIPFNKATNNNPEIQKAAKIIGRSPVALKMKVGNFGSYDPELKAKGIVGLSNSSKLDKEIWDEYSNDWEKLAYDSSQIIAKYTNQTIEQTIDAEDVDFSEGYVKERIVKQRINQSFFRDAVLSSYNGRCCITNLSCADLL
jgi:putative restriction endonuclease